MKNLIYLLLPLLLIFSTSCTESDPGPNLVDITATEYRFIAPDTIEAGWTTFSMTNKGTEEHFMLINPLAEGTSMDEARNKVAWVQDLHNAHEAGEIDRDSLSVILEEAFPSTGNVEYQGGMGLLSEGQSASTTTFLEPGRYLLECYSRNEDGIQHNHLGMMHELVVKETEKVTTPPDADYNIVLMNNGTSYPGTIPAGTHTFKVYFNEHPQEGHRGNDMHLYKAKDKQSVMETKNWVDVFEVDGMVTPAPVTFLGGTQEVPSRGVAYFTVDLKPGKYYGIAESDKKLPGNSLSFIVE